MHHPGPPRFAAVGEVVELAPRDPDPAETYRWRIAAAPAASTVELGGDPVVRFAPDAPGTYTAELSAPDGTHEVTVRALPGTADTTARGGRSGRSGGALDDRATAAEDAVSGAPEADDGDSGRPRIRLDARQAGGMVVVEADPRPNPASGEHPGDLDVSFVLDDRDDLRPADVEAGDRTLRIPADRLPGRARVHAVAVGKGGYSVPDVVDIRHDAGAIEFGRPYDPPEWATDAVIYEIYVRTFGDERAPFDAIADRLPYLEDLGVDVLWLTPVLENDHAPHGYNVTDFFSIASDLGDRADYERLVEAAHDHGMKVLFDLVLNHSARTHPFFEDAYGNPDSPYRDWYEWQPSGEPGTYFGWEHIANFDFDTLAVRRHLLDVVAEWFPLVDGFRCDMAWAVPNTFWRELHDYAKERDPSFLLLDETIPYIPDFQAGLFDMHFDSTTAFTLREVGAGRRPADAMLDAVEERREVGFPDHAGFMLYAENHDESRYLAECGEGAAMAAAGALATLPGTPMIYAGQELGQLGRRDALRWEQANEAIRDQYRRLIALRTEHPALAGDAEFRRVDYDADSEAVTAYVRVAEEEAVVVVLNFGEAPARVELDADVGTTDLASGASVGGGALRVEDALVLPAPPDVGRNRGARRDPGAL